MRRRSNPSNEGTNRGATTVRPAVERSGAAAPDEPGAQRAGNRERDRPERVPRNGAVQCIERRDGSCRSPRDADEGLRLGPDGVTVCPASPRRCCGRGPAGPRRLRDHGAGSLAGGRCGGRGTARDHRGGIRAAAVGVLDRGDVSRPRRPWGCKEQTPSRSSDLRPHAAEVNRWACDRQPRHPGTGRNLRSVRLRRVIVSELWFPALGQRSSRASATTFRCRSAARSST